MDYLLEGSNSYNINIKIHCINCYAELLINFSIYFEEDENFQVLNTFKKLLRDNNRLVQYTSLAQLFRIVSIFAKERNSFAPSLYKTLTFHLIEHHSDINLKEFIMNNFCNVFKTILSIPVGILIEPYIKQINVSLGISSIFNLIGINFLVILVKHPRLNIKDAILVLDVLGKIYYDINNKGIVYYNIIRGVFTMILSRYLMHEIGVEYCFKYIKMLLETFCRIDKPFSDKIYVNSIVLNQSPEQNMNLIVNPQDFALNIINFEIFAKDVIGDMINDILNINNSFINNVVKSLLITIDLRHFQLYNFHNTKIFKILDFFGNAIDIVHYYNLNNDELDVDKEFEITIELIYDRLPEGQIGLKKISKKQKLEQIKDENDYNNENTKTNTKFSINSESSKNKLKKNQLDMIKQLRIEMDQKKLDMIKGSKSTKNNNYKKHKQSIKINETLNNNIVLLNLNNEEDKDLILLKNLLKDYTRFFKFIFNKYCGSIYNPIHGKLFNSIKEIADTISPTEVVKMFKEHDVCIVGGNFYNEGNAISLLNPRLINKVEILLILGLMNIKVFNKPNSKAGINLEEFKEVFIQI